MATDVSYLKEAESTIGNTILVVPRLPPIADLNPMTEDTASIEIKGAQPPLCPLYYALDYSKISETGGQI